MVLIKLFLRVHEGRKHIPGISTTADKLLHLLQLLRQYKAGQERAVLGSEKTPPWSPRSDGANRAVRSLENTQVNAAIHAHTRQKPAT